MPFNTLPNWFTIGRILFLPAILVLASFPEKGFGVAAAIVFSLAAITDFLDGFIARKTGQVSDFGRLVDPIADKIIVASAMIMLVHLDRVPAWMVALIISREFAVSGLRAYAGTKNVVVSARFTGKIKMTLQVLAIIGLLVNYHLWGFPFGEVGFVLFLAAFAATLWSGYEYFADFFKDFRGRSEEVQEQTTQDS
ncbi:MAG: CDP-diacylglycerol--glycerol-3-phosphate 3-phosphatidyltransferase [Deltaproteobacteria bacterium]|nr:CDP-diacylglycerol--glycerol-3-phosphate 3-phosphatidyltransferase [Deltaproteobacteria bacterium]